MLLRIGGEKGCELVELLLPEDLVLRDPSLCIAQRCPNEATAAHASHSADIGEPRAFEHPQVLGHAGQRHVELRRKLTDRAFPRGELAEDRTSRRVSERAKGGVEGELTEG